MASTVTDSTSSSIGFLSGWSRPSVKKVRWDVYQFIREIKEVESELRIRDTDIKSDVFSFADGTWNLFAKIEQTPYRCNGREYFKTRFTFGISVRKPSHAIFACCCNIYFENIYGKEISESLWSGSSSSDFICENTDLHSESICSLSGGDKDTFLLVGAFIVCEISVMKSIIKKASSRAEINHSSGSSDVESPSEIQLLENEEEDLSTTSFDGKVCQDLKNLLLSEEFSDVTIKIGDKQFKAHWSILAARSPVFASMLRHDTKEKATGVVDVEDCDLSSFPVFLEYVYCESTERISPENVFHLYVCADKYDVQDLKRKCLEFMTTNLSVDNFCETLRLCLQHSEKKLLKLATEFFINNFQEIILTPKWQTFLSENPVQGNELFIKAAKTIK